MSNQFECSDALTPLYFLYTIFFLARKVCLKKKSNLLQTNEKKMKYPTLSIAIRCSQSKAVDIEKVKNCQHIRLLNDCLQNIHLRVFFSFLQSISELVILEKYKMSPSHSSSSLTRRPFLRKYTYIPSNSR